MLNDHELKLKFPMRQDGRNVFKLENAKYKVHCTYVFVARSIYQTSDDDGQIQPIVDHEIMYKAVQETLKRGRGIGLFVCMCKKMLMRRSVIS